MKFRTNPALRGEKRGGAERHYSLRSSAKWDLVLYSITIFDLPPKSAKKGWEINMGEGINMISTV